MTLSVDADRSLERERRNRRLAPEALVVARNLAPFKDYPRATSQLRIRR
jgi:hypothetical protein